MAVEDKYVNTSVEAGKIAAAAITNGAETITMVATEEVAAADDDGSVYRFFPSVPSNLIPVEVNIMCDEITAGTDYDLGIYRENSGAVVDKDLLMDGQTLATALTRATGHQLGLAAVGIADGEKTLADLDAVSDDPYPAYDIALTGNTVGSAAGTVTITATFIVR